MVGETCSRKGTFVGTGFIRSPQNSPTSLAMEIANVGVTVLHRPAFFQVLVTKMVVGTGPGLIINIFIFIFLVTELAVTTTSDSSC